MNPRKAFASRVDGNAKEIDAALAARGVSILRLDMIGKGCPDRLCGFNGLSVLIEYKRDYNYPTTNHGKPYVQRIRGKLTADQERWHREWKGQPVVVVRTPAEALKCFGLTV